MKYFFLVGEASGDLHASHLIEALKQQDPAASFSGFGGDKMAAAGCKLYRHINDLAFMGFVAVLKNISTIRQNFAIAKQALLTEQPDVLVLVDYPSFNLKMAQFARKHLPSLRIVYYIPPKVWAWKQWRRKTILKVCDQVLCIFPFEPAFYLAPSQPPIQGAEKRAQVIYVGNPTAEECRASRTSGISGISGSSAQRSKTIAILPGSRRSEIANCLPKMLEAARRFPDYEIRIAQAPSIPMEFYEQILSTLNLGTTLNSKLSTLNYDLLRTAAVAIVNSGTATLEAAMFGCPEVAVYHVACPHLLRLIWKAIFTIRHFTLPNIILDKRNEKGEPQEVIRELIADLFTVENIEAEVKRLLEDEPYRQTMLNDFEQLRTLLGDQPVASVAAQYIINGKL
ncbi:MAG: lipid-A-disaccharide synthase [Paludibacteraceae bacterium]|nr:lipid-A-disaccharide synthase [Paludibacteraceae bacterium]